MPAVYRFGRSELRPATRQLLVEGTEIALGARAFDVLLALIENRDRLVTKNELLDRVWQGVVVEENNLQVQISTLRKILGPQVIATIPGRGYRFAQPPEEPLAAAPIADTAAAVSIDLLQMTAPPPRDGSLPEPPGPLLGREADVQAVTTLVSEHRVVTVVGPGGIGKTRLALAVAHGQRGTVRDGVWWIELAAIDDVRLIAPAVIRALGLDVGKVADPRTALIRALASSETLIVLDNCEHLLAGVVPLLQDCLKTSPRTRWLLTSQEPLKLAAGHVYRLGTLALPPDDASVAMALQFGAVALLAERAQAADRRWMLNDDNVAAAIGICRQLDGIALAIEMAAARVPLLGVAGVRDRLDARMRLLGGVRDAGPSQQRTLRSALDWSHSLLTPIEQIAFRRLAVFVGGFTLVPAQHVVAGRPGDPIAAGLDEWTVLDALGALVDKSLVIADGRETPRYRMLESARMYALERLNDAGEVERIKLRHAAAMAQLFTEAEQTKWTLTEAQWYERFAPELDNLRAAFDTAFAAGETDNAVTLAAETFMLCRDLGHYGEARERLEAIRPWLQRARPPVAALGYFSLADFGDAVYQARIEAANEAHARYRALGDTRRQYLTATTSVGLFARSGRLTEAAALIIEAEQLEDPTWPPRLRANGYNAKSMVAEAAGDITTAKRAMRQAIALDRAAGWTSRVETRLTNLVAISLAAGETAEAIALSAELLTSQAGGRPIPGLAYMNLTGALVLDGRLAEARSTARVGLPLMQRKAQGHLFIDHLALLAAKEGRPADAAQLLGWADAMYAADGMHRDPEEKNARAQALAIVDAALGKEARERLMTAATKLTEDEAVAIAFAEPV